jgi:DNA-binding beta-propeller fold protein YncE
MVADTGNSRVVEYDPPFGTAPSAASVLGQDDASSFTLNRCSSGIAPAALDGVGADTLCMPEGVAFDAAENLWVADSANNRVLEFNHPAPPPTATPTATATATASRDVDADAHFDSGRLRPCPRRRPLRPPLRRRNQYRHRRR